MLQAFSRLFSLLESLGGFSSLGAKLELLRVVSAALSRLPTADGSRDYHSIAITVLEGVAPITTTPIDDGALIAARALALDAGWHDWVDAQLEATPAPVIPEGVPADARVLTLQAPAAPPAWVEHQVQAFSLGGVSTFMQFLPLLLEIIRELKALRTPTATE